MNNANPAQLTLDIPGLPGSPEHDAAYEQIERDTQRLLDLFDNVTIRAFSRQLAPDLRDRLDAIVSEHAANLLTAPVDD